MTIQSYLDTLNLRYKTGIIKEHTYREVQDEKTNNYT